VEVSHESPLRVKLKVDSIYSYNTELLTRYFLQLGYEKELSKMYLRYRSSGSVALPVVTVVAIPTPGYLPQAEAMAIVYEPIINILLSLGRPD